MVLTAMSFLAEKSCPHIRNETINTVSQFSNDGGTGFRKFIKSLNIVEADSP